MGRKQRQRRQNFSAGVPSSAVKVIPASQRKEEFWSPLRLIVILCFTVLSVVVFVYRVNFFSKANLVNVVFLWIFYLRSAKRAGRLRADLEVLLTIVRKVVQSSLPVLFIGTVVALFGFGVSGLQGVYDGLAGVLFGFGYGLVLFGRPTLICFTFGILSACRVGLTAGVTHSALEYVIISALLGFINGLAPSLRRAFYCGGLIARVYMCIYQSRWVLRPTLRKDRKRLTLYVIALNGVGLFAAGLSYFSLFFAGLLGATAVLAGLLGILIGQQLRQHILYIRVLLRLFRKLSNAFAAFCVGYFSIVLLFASFFMAAWRLNPKAFGGQGFPASPHYSDFLYFSIVTAATLGYGDITPVTVFARILASLEVIVALGWTAVILGAVAGFVQPTVATLARRSHY